MSQALQAQPAKLSAASLRDAIRQGEGAAIGGVNTVSAHFPLLIQTQPGIKTSELVAQTGKPQRTIERWLKQHKENDQIEFRGAPKTNGHHIKNQMTTKP